MTRIAAALAALVLSAIVISLSVYGPQWIFHAPYIRDLSFENVRAHGVPRWWDTANLIVVAGILGFAVLRIRRRRAKRAQKDRR
jgi:TRAP-type C4-dicarboxylate transport system permease small subunit